MRNECLVDLHKVTEIDLLKLTSLEEMKAAADSFDMVKRLEEILMVWHAQIDQVCPSVCLFAWSISEKEHTSNETAHCDISLCVSVDH